MNLSEDSSIIIPPSCGIQEHVPLADKNWFKTGGNARYFAQPQNNYAFKEALEFARHNNLEIFLLGNGANILISDDGFDGLVIQPHLKNISIEPFDDHHSLVTAEAGVLLDDLIECCLNHNLSGLEEFSGIPGTVGGAVYINLHYFEFLLEQFLIRAQVIEKNSGIIKHVDSTWFDFNYNDSKLIKAHHYLLSASFKLKKVTDEHIAYARGRKKEIIRHRNARYPSSNTCGSFFRNFHEDEVDLVVDNKKMIFVGYYLDKIGVKGALTVGDAAVSHKHANMIINRGTATSTDIINLARTMQELVQEKFGIVPQPECRLIGFKDYPLL